MNKELQDAVAAYLDKYSDAGYDDVIDELQAAVDEFYKKKEEQKKEKKIAEARGAVVAAMLEYMKAFGVSFTNREYAEYSKEIMNGLEGIEPELEKIMGITENVKESDSDSDAEIIRKFLECIV